MTTAAESQERLRAYHARHEQYLHLGHDRPAAARFIVESAGALRGPALDVGTGKGLLAMALANQGLEVVSVDVDAAEQALARQLAAEAGRDGCIRFVRGDGARLGFADAGFGCVAMMDVLHHLADAGPVLREMTRVLAAGGGFVLADFDEAGFALVERVHRAEGRTHPRTATTVAHARDILLAAGLTCVRQTQGHLHDVVVMIKN
jgi:ubiquinone/menaquinone biosynthesis C-methylase UbiE